MSLIHRSGRVNPGLVQPDSCSSVPTPSLPPYLLLLFLSLFSPGSISPSLISHLIFWAGSQVKQARSGLIRKTSAITQRFDTNHRPHFKPLEARSRIKMPVPLAAKGTYELHHVASLCTVFYQLSETLPAHSSSHLFLRLLPLCIVILHALEAALVGVRSHVPLAQ